MKKTLLLTLFCICTYFSFAQANSDFIYWSKNRPLKKSDFRIGKTRGDQTHSMGQFGWNCKPGANFFTQLPADYKQRIRNYFIKSSAIIDTGHNVAMAIKFQQTLFNLSEIYIRRLRKAVFTSSAQSGWGRNKFDALFTSAQNDFTQRRGLYEKETNYGTHPDKQATWEATIKKELEELNAFSAD